MGLLQNATIKMSEVWSPKGFPNLAHCFDNAVHILASDTERDSVHITKSFEKNAFALHDRHTSLRADIIRSQHSGAISNHRRCVPTAGQIITLIYVFLNPKTGGPRHQACRPGTVYLWNLQRHGTTIPASPSTGSADEGILLCNP